jgi:hypothetical protein
MPNPTTARTRTATTPVRSSLYSWSHRLRRLLRQRRGRLVRGLENLLDELLLRLALIEPVRVSVRSREQR